MAVSKVQAAIARTIGTVLAMIAVLTIWQLAGYIGGPAQPTPLVPMFLFGAAVLFQWFGAELEDKREA